MLFYFAVCCRTTMAKRDCKLERACIGGDELSAQMCCIKNPWWGVRYKDIRDDGVVQAQNDVLDGEQFLIEVELEDEFLPT